MEAKQASYRTGPLSLIPVAHLRPTAPPAGASTLPDPSSKASVPTDAPAPLATSPATPCPCPPPTSSSALWERKVSTQFFAPLTAPTATTAWTSPLFPEDRQPTVY